MSQDYRLPEFNQYIYMQPACEMQPAQTQHYPFQLHHLPQPMSNQSTTSSYEMTATSAGNACADGTLPPAQTIYPHDPRKRKSTSFPDFEMNETLCSSSESSVATSNNRKRKISSFGSASTFDDDGSEDVRSSRSSTNISDRKQNHSEIEKRRRDKMNTYITELSSMIPMCGAIARKLDKLTVLRMAVQHLRTVRGSLSAYPFTARPRPAFVSERELNSLILQAANDSFLIVVSCDRGRLLYVSHSVNAMLNYDQAELLGQSMFDILHPKDVAKVKEQLSSSDLSPRERLIDAKTMLPVKSDVVAGAQRLCAGARRSFLCRIKCKQPPGSNTASAPAPSPTPIKEEADTATKLRKKNDKKYCVVQCTGYLKSWVPADMEGGGAAEGDEEQCTMSCLVAIGRTLPELMPLPPTPAVSLRRLQYVSRHAIDGKFLFVDQRVTLALGFLPQELLGTSLYEYVSGPDLGAVARSHKQALMRRDPLVTPPYSILKKDGSVATIQTHFKPFRNPWTKEVECLVAKNSILADSLNSEDAQLHYETFKQTDEWRDYLTGIKGTVKEDCIETGGDVTQGADQRELDLAKPLSSENDADVQRLIDSQMESYKIGSAIAEEALRRPPSAAFASPALLLQDPIFNQALVDNILGVELNVDGVPASPLGQSSSPPLAPLGLDGNGEAAMAVIMSLLEADAGLGGPVNFSGLPWPLP